jgi:hypothetical protein
MKYTCDDFKSGDKIRIIKDYSDGLKLIKKGTITTVSLADLTGSLKLEDIGGYLFFDDSQFNVNDLAVKINYIEMLKDLL